jgi:metal-responsive CopG/Arc/MetJ family transcriptional regulator
VSRMQRTQIYLQLELSAALDRLARERRTSRAALIRLAARRFVEQEEAEEEDSIMGVMGLGHGGPGNISEEHDRYLAELTLRDMHT